MTFTQEKVAAPKTRDQIPEESKWQVDILYPSFEAWERDFNSLRKESPPHFPELVRFSGRLGEGVQTVKEAIETLLSLSRKMEKLYMYAHLKHDEAVGKPETKALFEKFLWLSSEFDKEKAFFEPELLALSEEKLQALLSATELAPYRFFLEKIIRLRPHTLSADKELLLAMARKPLTASSKAFSAFNNADMKFPEVKDSKGKSYPLSHGLYSLYLRSPDRSLRKNSFETMQGRYGEFENTFAELLSGEVESGIFMSRARGFKSSLASALYPWAIPEKVYTTLIETVRANRAALDRYIALKKRLLKLDELHFYDLYALPENVKDPVFTKEESVSLVIEAVKPLGKEYQEKLERGFRSERWVDWEESAQKRSGAYSSGGYDSHPYILMNFRGSLRDLFTLAHEAGHSMHTLLSKEKQSFQDYRYPIFVAEIASTLNEELLMHSLLTKIKKPEERLLLIHERIEDIRATFFRQTLFAEFELALSSLAERGEPLMAESIKQLYIQIYRDYYGPSLVLDPLLNMEWARIPHFYYHFYVYQYATGIASAIALAGNVLKGDSKSYLDFLAAGGSRYPLDLLKVAGLDLTTPAPITSAIQRFHYWMDELEKAMQA